MSISSSVESMERRAADRRRVRTVVAVTFVTTVSGTLSLLFGFFGINARQVDDHRSMFDDHYTPIYALIATILLCALAIFAGMRLSRNAGKNAGTAAELAPGKAPTASWPAKPAPSSSMLRHRPLRSLALAAQGQETSPRAPRPADAAGHSAGSRGNVSPAAFSAAGAFLLMTSPLPQVTSPCALHDQSSCAAPAKDSNLRPST
ncbi:hypothetical protein AB0O20_24675 [Streptomyces kronopolitis]|uniref:hypothetical protein n=1 Tax=Streptomyces kronopolitis TaxID=1612435 RepID=UPI003442971C